LARLLAQQLPALTFACKLKERLIVIQALVFAQIVRLHFKRLILLWRDLAEQPQAVTPLFKAAMHWGTLFFVEPMETTKLARLLGLIAL
jgi:hypothetical protein